jgi:GNAT superfamily N-acetyltransferase
MTIAAIDSGSIFRRLKEGEVVQEFDCGEAYEDLNDFIINDAHLYRKELLAVTYVVEDACKTLAYCSLANDRIGIEDFPTGTAYNRFRRKKFVNAKRIKHYPAIKICRLGVDVGHQDKGLGTLIVDTVKWYFLDNNKSGCRYITVDAHKDAVQFYKKNGFVELVETSHSLASDTTLMFYDLMALKQAI